MEHSFGVHSENTQGTFREHSGNIQGKFIQGTFGEHSGSIHGTNIQETFREHSEDSFLPDNRSFQAAVMEYQVRLLDV
jgi:hypothetical protein